MIDFAEVEDFFSETESRTYSETHSWINFHDPLPKAQPKLWIMLGEAQSKCEHIAGVPLKTDTALKLHMAYFAKGVRATTAIEGNTLSEEEVHRAINGKLEVPISKEYLKQEVENMVGLLQSIMERVDNLPHITPGWIKRVNKAVLRNLPVANGVIPGEIRTFRVGVGSYSGAPFEDCEYLLRRLCKWLKIEELASLPTDDRMVLGIVKAIIAHVYIAWIHPFGDGNGRTSRLIEFQILVRAGVPSPAAHLLSNFYNETRQEYYRQLDATSKSGGNLNPFLEYAVRGFVDNLKSQLAYIKEQQLEVAWRDYVHEQFGVHPSPSESRRQTLVLALPREPLPLAKILNHSPDIAREYARKTTKTLIRDLNDLVERELVAKTEHGYCANTDLVNAFLPKRRSEASPCAMEDDS